MTDRRAFFGRCAGMAAGATALTALPAYAQSTVQHGIDVSHWQGPSVNWTSVKNSGVTFAICKCTEGTSYFDDTFNINWAGMKANGILRSAYHYGRPAIDPVAQARFFYDKVRPSSGDMPLVLDFENDDGLTPTQVRYWAQKFVAELKRKLGRPPIIYTGFYFWRDEAGNSPNNYDCPLWIARYVTDYQTGAPIMPAAWPNWTFWQWTSTGSVPGVSGNCDRDVYYGSLASLQSMQLP